MNVINKLKNVLKSQAIKRLFSVCSFLMVGVCFVMANSQAGRNALEKVAADVEAYIPTVQKVIYAIAGVIAVIGSIQVYMKMNNGDQDVSKSIMMLVGSCIFLVAAAVALPSFF